MQHDQRRLLDEFKDLLRVRPEVDAAVIATVRRLRDAGVTWHTIGQANFMTRQAAIMRWGSKVRAAQPLIQESPATAEEIRRRIARSASTLVRASEAPSKGTAAIHLQEHRTRDTDARSPS